MKIRVKECRVVSLDIYPGENGTTQVLEVVGLLTPSIADKLQIKDGTYNEDGIPRNYASFPTSSLRMDGADVELGEKTFASTLIYKFSVKPPKAKKQQGVVLEVHFLMHFGGKEALKFWVDRTNTDTFTANISARQEDLQFGGKDAEDGEEDGAEDATAEDVGCTSCNANNPMGIGGYHINGQKCSAPKEETEKSDGPALASAREVGVGTHQKSPRGRPPRDRLREAISDGSAEDQVN